MRTSGSTELRDFPPGTPVFLRQAGGNHWTGEVLRYEPMLHAVILIRAAWIGNTGVFSEWCAKGSAHLQEVHPIPVDMEVTVPLAYAELFQWPHPLPAPK